MHMHNTVANELQSQAQDDMKMATTTTTQRKHTFENLNENHDTQNYETMESLLINAAAAAAPCSSAFVNCNNIEIEYFSKS